MAKTGLPELMKKVDASSSLLADVSTKISERIVAFERRLNELPGKVIVEVASRVVGKLSFGRRGSGWCLYFSPKDQPQTSRLVDFSVEEKAVAIELFADLLKQMERTQASKANVLSIALRNIDAVMGSLGTTDEEGA